MPRQGLNDTTAVPAGLFDKCGQDQGFFDRDLLYFPTGPTPPPWYLSLLYTGGWDPTSDEFFKGDPALVANVAWELGADGYGREVTFRSFEGKILAEQRDTEKRAEFRQMAEVYAAEHAAKMKIIKRAITIAGVTYIVWKIVMWL